MEKQGLKWFEGSMTDSEAIGAAVLTRQVKHVAQLIGLRAPVVASALAGMQVATSEEMGEGRAAFLERMGAAWDLCRGRARG